MPRVPRYGESRDDGPYRTVFFPEEAEAIVEAAELILASGAHRTWPKLKSLLRRAGFVVDDIEVKDEIA